MRRANHPPFQARVASVAIITTVAVLVAACLSFLLQQWGVARQESRQHFGALADVVAASAGPALASGDITSTARTLASVGKAEALVDARLTDPAGVLLARYAAPAPKPADAARPIDTVSRD